MTPKSMSVHELGIILWSWVGFAGPIESSMALTGCPFGLVGNLSICIEREISRLRFKITRFQLKKTASAKATHALWDRSAVGGAAGGPSLACFKI